MMRVRSIGAVTTHGRGLDGLIQAVKGGECGEVNPCKAGPDSTVPAFTVPDEALRSSKIPKSMRRADRLSRMAVLAAMEARDKNGLDEVDPERIGVILATGLGPHQRTFRFLDGLLEFGDDAGSPTDFSHSVHNAPAAYVSSVLQVRGPVHTVTDFDFGFQHALRLAECWLENDRSDVVLLGMAEELGEVMLHVCSRMLDMPAKGLMRPFAFAERPAIVPGEGSIFLALERLRPGRRGVQLGVEDRIEEDADILIADAEGMSGPETHYRRLCDGHRAVANYVPVFGSMMTGTACQCAVAARMLQEGQVYPNPVFEADNDIRTDLRGMAAPATIRCAKRGKDGRWMDVWLRSV